MARRVTIIIALIGLVFVLWPRIFAGSGPPPDKVVQQALDVLHPCSHQGKVLGQLDTIDVGLLTLHKEGRFCCA